MIRVENIETPNGNKAINQFHIELTGHGVDVFQSYSTTIAVHDKRGKTMYVNEDYYKYSRTTSKYYKIWLNDYVLPFIFKSELEYQVLSNDNFILAVTAFINKRIKN